MRCSAGADAFLRRTPGTAGTSVQSPANSGTASAAGEGSRESVDAGCRNLTASWVREKAVNDGAMELCEYFEGLENAGPEVPTCQIQILTHVM